MWRHQKQDQMQIKVHQGRMHCMHCIQDKNNEGWYVFTGKDNTIVWTLQKLIPWSQNNQYQPCSNPIPKNIFKTSRLASAFTVHACNYMYTCSFVADCSIAEVIHISIVYMAGRKFLLYAQNGPIVSLAQCSKVQNRRFVVIDPSFWIGCTLSSQQPRHELHYIFQILSRFHGQSVFEDLQGSSTHNY